MTRMIFCHKLQQEQPGLLTPPYPGELGQRIYQYISQPAWTLWITHQTMLINEYRLSLIQQKDRDFLKQEMEKFLFGEGSQKPEGFQPEK